MCLKNNEYFHFSNKNIYSFVYWILIQHWRFWPKHSSNSIAFSSSRWLLTKLNIFWKSEQVIQSHVWRLYGLGHHFIIISDQKLARKHRCVSICIIVNQCIWTFFANDWQVVFLNISLTWCSEFMMQYAVCKTQFLHVRPFKKGRQDFFIYP